MEKQTNFFIFCRWNPKRVLRVIHSIWWKASFIHAVMHACTVHCAIRCEWVFIHLLYLLQIRCATCFLQHRCQLQSIVFSSFILCSSSSHPTLSISSYNRLTLALYTYYVVWKQKKRKKMLTIFHCLNNSIQFVAYAFKCVHSPCAVMNQSLKISLKIANNNNNGNDSTTNKQIAHEPNIIQDIKAFRCAVLYRYICCLMRVMWLSDVDESRNSR